MEEFREDKKYAEYLSKELAMVTIENLVCSMRLLFDRTLGCGKLDNLRCDDEYLIGGSLSLSDHYIPAPVETPWVYRMVVDKQICMNHNLFLTDIKVAIYDIMVKCLHKKNMQKKYSSAMVERFSIMSGSIHDDEWVIHLRLGFSEDITITKKHLVNLYTTLLQPSCVKGVEGIDATSVEKIPYFSIDNNGSLKESFEYAVICKGVNLIPIFQFYGVDRSRCVINDVSLTQELYGIESARTILREEIRKTYESGGISLNCQHYNMLCDIMTRNGTLTSINRYGLNKLESDPLSKASFEQTMSELLNASIYQEQDKIRSVSSRIMCGKAIGGGTGIVQIIPQLDCDIKSQDDDKDNQIPDPVLFRFDDVLADALL